MSLDFKCWWFVFVSHCRGYSPRGRRSPRRRSISPPRRCSYSRSPAYRRARQDSPYANGYVLFVLVNDVASLTTWGVQHFEWTNFQRNRDMSLIIVEQNIILHLFNVFIQALMIDFFFLFFSAETKDGWYVIWNAHWMMLQCHLCFTVVLVEMVEQTRIMLVMFMSWQWLMIETWVWIASTKCFSRQKGCLGHRFALAFSLQLTETWRSLSYFKLSPYWLLYFYFNWLW